MMPPREELEPLRFTTLTSTPVQAYRLPGGTDNKNPAWVRPNGEVDLHQLGFHCADPDTVKDVRSNLGYGYPDGIHVFCKVDGSGLWLWLGQENQFFLVPYPLKELPFEAGDRVFECGSEFRAELRCGEIKGTVAATVAAPIGRIADAYVHVLWDGTTEPQLKIPRERIALLQSWHPRCRLEPAVLC